MKLGLASKEFVNGNIKRNVNTIIKTMKQNNDLDLILFPEAFIHGFDGLTFDYTIDKHRALSKDSPIFENLKDYCNKLSLGLGFGYIELDGDNLYSSFMVIGKNGECVDNYKRISPGWKEEFADHHYAEGDDFHTFVFDEKTFVTAICGDLWYNENIEILHKLNYDFVLWPNYNSYSKKLWENQEKKEYAIRAKMIGKNVFWFNSHNNSENDKANGGAIYFKEGEIYKELPMKQKDILIFDI